MELSFLGAAGTVTGSKYLLAQDGHQFLVDCGLFQGFKALRLRNWAPFPVSPKDVDAVVLSHAHLDHSGYLPLLKKRGFRGHIYCTAASEELCGILLTDSGYLQEREADFANRHGFSKHHPALPLYTEDDARQALRWFRSVHFHQTIKLPGGAMVRLRRAGHILGAGSVHVEWGGNSILFSGDLGRYDDPVMLDPEPGPDVQYLVVESTYGDRLHDRQHPADALASIITRTIQRGGTVIIPAFAVGRAQTLLYHLQKLKKVKRLPKALPVFLDSPMAIDASDIFCRHQKDHKLSDAECREFRTAAHYVHDAEESKAVMMRAGPKVIISASGMATGGRVLHHIKHYAPGRANTILFSGFQAGGTRGAAMVAGAQTVKIYGQYVPIRAEVHNLDMLSAHADYEEIMRWLHTFARPPRKTFVTHGEPAAADAMRHRIEEELGWQCSVPDLGAKEIL